MSLKERVAEVAEDPALFVQVLFKVNPTPYQARLLRVRSKRIVLEK